MLFGLHLRRPARIVSLLLLSLLLLSLLPARPSNAQTGEIQYIDNNQGDFADGVFERTAIGPFDSTTITEDEPGITQLAPAGVLNEWDTSVPGLPLPISNPGVVAVRNYLFAVGGETAAGKSDKAYRAIINQSTGRPVPYDTGTGLVWKEYSIQAAPASQLESCVGETAAARTRHGVVATESSTPGTLGYIYLIGGVVDLNCEPDITTPLVQIAVVNSSGDISSWVRAPDFPTATSPTGIDEQALGIADPMVAIVRTSSNERFLYVLGGLSINPEGFGFNRDVIHKTFFYTKINPATGALVHPSNGSTSAPWARGTDIDLVDAAADGIRDGTLIAARATKIEDTGTAVKDGLFVAGGCYDPFVCNDPDNNNNYLIRGDINPSTGAVTWDKQPSSGAQQNVTIDGRGGLAGIAYNNKLYLIGGSTSGNPGEGTFTVPTSFYDADLNALRLGDSGDFFIGPNDRVLPTSTDDTGERTDLGVAIIPALPPEGGAPDSLNAAWVFAVGGTNKAGEREDTIFIGRIGGDDEASGSRRTRDGWYYSAPIDITISGQLARVLTLRWTAEINRERNQKADIRMEFRKTITGDGQCQEEDFSLTAPSDRWRVLDVNGTGTEFYSESNTAADPFNIIELDELFAGEDIDATCFQYRAYFMQNGPDPNATIDDEGGTPRLLSFSIEKILSGNADLKLKSFVVQTTEGRMRSIRIQIENLSNRGLDKTLPVVDATGADGSFFVNLCVAYAPPSANDFPALELPQPTDPGTNPQCSQAYAEIFNRQMDKGSVISLDQSLAWRRNSDNRPVDLRELFREPGKYRIGVVIDFQRVIPEGSDGELNNRGETDTAPTGRTIPFEIRDDPLFTLNLPIVYQ